MAKVVSLGLIGCGLVAGKRCAAIESAGAQLTACADSDGARASGLASAHPGCVWHTDWHMVIDSKQVEAVIVATPHHLLAEIGRAAVAAGKHVLIEKPGARNSGELKAVVEAYASKKVCVRVGFNHRFHPAIAQAKQLVDGGRIGALMYIRARYGHGGRVGYEKEWRADPALSGGGELIDQGVHLIDLSRWFLGSFCAAEAHLPTCFWKMPVEDNAFITLKTSLGQTAFLHASWTEWKNLFCFEIFGQKGKLMIEGLGGSYGVEQLTLYQMSDRMGPPEVSAWPYPEPDRSWQAELDSFLGGVRADGTQAHGCDLSQAIEVLEIVDKLYRNKSS